MQTERADRAGEHYGKVSNRRAKTILPFGLRMNTSRLRTLRFLQRLLCAALYLSCALLRAATGFPELPGFFTETTAGVYQSRGARLAVMQAPTWCASADLR